jgi:predicted RNase H-like nuclease (RuvC/YqgF family)
MAFTVSDFNDLLRLLEEHPEWRAELRRVLLGIEILELPTVVARLAAAVEKLTEEVRHLTERMDAVESRLERVESGLERVETVQEQMLGRLDQLESGQQRLEAGQQRLEGQQQRMQGTLDQLVGSDLERKFRELALSTFGRWLRRLRPVEKHELDAAFGDVIDREQFLDLMRADAVLRGRLGAGMGQPEVWLVAEVSKVVDREDVERAARRAAVLRQAGVAVVGVAAGEDITEGGTTLAAQQHIAVQQDGRVSGWDEALAAAGLAA